MPIILDNTQAVTSQQTNLYMPTFFSSKLTGNGKKQGLLSQAVNPINLTKNKGLPPYEADVPKTAIRNNGTEEYHIPLFVLPFEVYQCISIETSEDLDHAVKIGAVIDNANKKHDIYFQAVPHALDELLTPPPPGSVSRTKDRTITVTYDVRITMQWDPTDTNYPHEFSSTVSHAVDELPAKNHVNHACAGNLVNAIDYVQQGMSRLQNNFYQPYTVKFDRATLEDYIANYSLFDEICALAEIWETTLPEHINYLFTATSNHKKQMTQTAASLICSLLNRLEDYKIPLGLYRDIYDDIAKAYTPDLATAFCKENLNLLKFIQSFSVFFKLLRNWIEVIGRR